MSCDSWVFSWLAGLHLSYFRGKESLEFCSKSLRNFSESPKGVAIHCQDSHAQHRRELSSSARTDGIPRHRRTVAACCECLHDEK